MGWRVIKTHLGCCMRLGCRLEGQEVEGQGQRRWGLESGTDPGLE